MTTPATQTPAPLTIGNFLNTPKTQKFLEDNLAEKKGEFVSNLLALCEADKNLAACDPKVLMMCAMNATALNLPLNRNLGFAYVIPYKNTPYFQIGYKGLIQLAIRTGMYKHLSAAEVREGEITRNKFTGEIRFNGEKPDAPVIGYMAFLELMSGFSASTYMSNDELEKHASRFSETYKSDKRNKTQISKWSDPDARPKMCIKTVLKSLLGMYGIMTTELQNAFDADGDGEAPAGRFADYHDVSDQPDPVPAKQPDPLPEQGEQKGERPTQQVLL